MKITLKNFRCYENSSFDFGDKGLVLLSGISGTGKTSIILGIYFALFGTGNKLAMYGKTSCSVTLEFNDMTITRTKRPNRVVVKTDGNKYEDDSAQSIINKKFGDSFKTTGYISQNARDSFILMSPIEKLGFIESFAFQDINLTQIKKRCKDLIKKRNENLLKTTSQLEMASLMIKEMEKPENIEFPLKCKKNRKIAIKNEIIRHKNTITLIKRCKKKIGVLHAELHSLEVLNAQLQSKQETLDTTIEKLADSSLEESKIEYEGDEKITEYENQLSLIISQRELIVLQNRYDDDTNRLNNMKKEEDNNKHTKISTIEESIWTEYTEDDCNNMIKEYKQTIKDLEKIQDLKHDLSKYKVDKTQLNTLIEDLEKAKESLNIKKKLIDKLEIQQEVFKCPSCSVGLRFNDDDLELYEGIGNNEDCLGDIDTLSEEISTLKRKISSLETTIPIKQNKLERSKEISKNITDIEDQYEEVPNIKEMKTELKDIRDYKSSQEELKRQLKNLTETNNYTSTIISFEKSLKQLSKKITEMKKDSDKKYNEINEEELRISITNQKQNKEKLKSTIYTIEKLTREQTIIEQQIESCKKVHLEQFNNINTTEKIKDNIKKQLTELTNLEEKHNEHQQNVENIEKYNDYIKNKDTYDSWETKIDVLQKEEYQCRKMYAATTLLREKILEAESIAMLNIISSINAHTQGYLESFFPEHPISVKLVPFKETKKGKSITKKPQINIEIEYKGMEADINMLSGGELSRVILAYALALGEMFNTPMMLLDECTSSLDQELTGVVMDGIREHFDGKLVLIIAHQVVKGQFDTVIKIGE